MPKRSLVPHFADAALRRVAHWISADPRDVVTFAPRRGGDDVDRVDGSTPADLTQGLRRWQHAIAVRRSLVVVRRAVTAAAAVAVVLLLVRLAAGSLTSWLLVALPLVTLAGVG
ncbi:MAG: hypothetical protein JWQ48_2922, partial [Conexibacter sp.]|nr:hypothetical protein [Conexibacter sp.]